jgi:hypothetical protein
MGFQYKLAQVCDPILRKKMSDTVSVHWILGSVSISQLRTLLLVWGTKIKITAPPRLPIQRSREAW